MIIKENTRIDEVNSYEKFLDFICAKDSNSMETLYFNLGEANEEDKNDLLTRLRQRQGDYDVDYPTINDAYIDDTISLSTYNERHWAQIISNEILDEVNEPVHWFKEEFGAKPSSDYYLGEELIDEFIKWDVKDSGGYNNSDDQTIQDILGYYGNKNINVTKVITLVGQYCR